MILTKNVKYVMLVYTRPLSIFCIQNPQTNVYHPMFSLGMFAIRSERDYVQQEDFMKAVRKVSDNKKLETKLDYKPV